MGPSTHVAECTAAFSISSNAQKTIPLATKLNIQKDSCSERLMRQQRMVEEQVLEIPVPKGLLHHLSKRLFSCLDQSLRGS